VSRHPVALPRPIPEQLAHAPELAILLALDRLLEMTTVTIHLSLPEIDLLQRDRNGLDPDASEPDLLVAQDILDLVDALRTTLRTYQNLVLRS